MVEAQHQSLIESRTSFWRTPEGTLDRPFVAIMAVAALAAIASGIAPLLREGALTRYDPIVALTALSVMVLGAYTKYTRSLLHATLLQPLVQKVAREEERRAHRAGVATAVLVEIAVLWKRLDSVHRADGSENPLGFFSHPMLDYACEHPELFDAATLKNLTTSRMLVADTHIGIDLYKAARRKVLDYREANYPAGQQPFIADTAEKLRVVKGEEPLRASAAEYRRAAGVRAIWAMEALARLVPCLEKAGGERPALPRQEPVELMAPLPVPHDPFERPAPPPRLDVQVLGEEVKEVTEPEQRNLYDALYQPTKLLLPEGEVVIWHPNGRAVSAEEVSLATAYMGAERQNRHHR